MIVNFWGFSIIKGTHGFWKKRSAHAGGLSNCIRSVFKMPRYPRLGWLSGSGVVLAFLYVPLMAAEPKVAAASSLNQVLQEISRLYRNHSGQSVKLIFGSSRELAHQIKAGAPYDIFLSSDAESIRLLQEDSRADGQQIVYGKGRLALFVAEGSPLRLSSFLRQAQ